ncbi:MAG: hypothetical protein ACX94D_00310 [Henriciella sp.]
MIKTLTALVMIASNIGPASGQTVQASYTELVGTWRCTTSFDDESSVTRVLTETTFDADGARTEAGHIQWFDANTTAIAEFTALIEVELKGAIIELDLVSIDIEEPRITRRTQKAGVFNPRLELENRVEIYKTYSSDAVFDVVELNGDRFATSAPDTGTRSLCVRKG